MPRMQGELRKTVAIALVVLGAVAAPVVAESMEAVRTVRGEVVAANVQDAPHTIVIKAMKGGKDELIVGATVGTDTKIFRGKQKIGLDGLKLGESVELSYAKQADGLAARSIRAR